MEKIRDYRRAERLNTLKFLSEQDRRTFTNVQSHSAKQQTDFLNLPEVALTEIQNPTTGEFYFMLGYDDWGEAPLGP